MIEEDRINKISIENEMKSAYIDYSMSVIVSRALPDVRDGLKPVHRRVLYAMNDMGNTSDKPLKKSATAVGEVIGKYHPHGDSSIYGTLVRLTQDWAMRYTLVEGHGNFGSIDGDSPAAMRYTEVRLRKMGEEMLTDLESDAVDFQPNFDNSRKEPVVLPTRFPNLLVNGASGIAVGMATNMPTHNLNESIDATIALIDNPEMTIPELMKIIKAPDFPTGGIIYGYQGVKEAYETGRGRIVIRAKADIEQVDNHECIIVHEIPYNVNKAELIKYIASLVNEKKLDGIADLNDESDYQGMRIVIQLKSDANSNVVLNKLFKMTQMQSSFSVNNVALVNGRPQLLNLKQLLQHFISHRHEVVIRRTRFQLGKAQERAHILKGLLVAVDHIDEVIHIIRASKDTNLAREQLMARFELSEAQCNAILAMQLRQLTGLEMEKLQAAYDEVMAEIARLELILNDESVCWNLIKTELREVKDKFGDERKTEINYTAGNFADEDFYADDDMIITISHMGYIKRTPLSEFRAQNRGGVGAKGSDTRDEDFIEYIYPASMHNDLLFFTKKGIYYRMKVYEITPGNKNSKGRAIQNLLEIAPDDAINAVIPIKGIKDTEFAESHNLVFATKLGVVKKTSLKEYVNAPTRGKKAIIIREDDQLIGVELTDGNSEIIMANRYGRAIRFHEKGVREMGRVSTGVRGMTLASPDDEVVGMICMATDTNNDILVVSENGYGKRSPLEDYRVTNRGGKGVKTINVTEKTGQLVAIKSVNDENDLVIINRSGITLRIRVADIRLQGRATQGVRLINLEKRNDVIASVCSTATDPEEESQEVDGAELPCDPSAESAQEEDDDNDAPANDANEE